MKEEINKKVATEMFMIMTANIDKFVKYIEDYNGDLESSDATFIAAAKDHLEMTSAVLKGTKTFNRFR